MIRRHLLFAFFLLAFLLLPAAALAATGGGTMPWDTGLTALLNGLTSGTARTVTGIMAVVAGIVYMTSDHSQGWKFISKVVVGACIALFAVNFLSLFGITGALL